MRRNKGRTSGRLEAQIEGWSLYKIEEPNKYKLCSIEAIPGKANYSFFTTSQRIDTHAGADAGALKADHARLFDAVNAYLAGIALNAEPQEDTYGDIALSRGQTLSPLQTYKRQLLHMRRMEVEYIAKQRAFKREWDTGVRMLYSGCFKEKISDKALADAIAYITRANGAVNIAALLQIERDFYDCKYRPDSCAALAANLEMLVGDSEDNFTDFL